MTYNQLFRLLAVIFLMWWNDWEREIKRGREQTNREERKTFVHVWHFFFVFLLLLLFLSVVLMNISSWYFIVIKFELALFLSLSTLPLSLLSEKQQIKDKQFNQFARCFDFHQKRIFLFFTLVWWAKLLQFYIENERDGNLIVSVLNVT